MHVAQHAILTLGWEAIHEAAEASDLKSGVASFSSLSHKMWPTEIYAENNGTFNISKEFNRQVDLMVLDSGNAAISRPSSKSCPNMPNIAMAKA